ncbi:MAG TPA: SpoIIE family protein phosphatase, partial [Candidatus Obscuribacterales bacterium]
HPHIVHVHEYGVLTDQTPYFTMEIVPGQELEQLGKVSIPLAWRILIQAAKALGFIHSRRLVHRDIKSENLRLQPDGQLKLMEFGLMEPLGNRSNGQLTGTVAYLPPEVPQRGQITEASDIYSLGVVAFEILTGVKPFLGTTMLDVIKAHMHSEPPPLRPFNPEIPEELERIVLKMLAKAPQDRHANTSELLAELAEASGLDAGLDSTAEKSSYLVSHVLVARDQELERLKGSLISMQEARSQAILIGAPAGVGKSRLIEEFKIHAQLSDIPFAQGICVAQGMSSYEPLIQAFHQLLPLTPPEVLIHLGPILAHLLPRLADQGFSPKPDFDPRNQKISLFETVVSWLSEVASRRPLVIFIDDLHWADMASLELFNYLVRELDTAPVLMLGSFRDDEVLPGSPLWQTVEEQITSFLKLQPFTPEQMAELIQKMLRDVQLPPDFIGYFFGATSGNAFFIREMLRYLMEEDLIRQIKGQWIIPENYTEWELPTSIGDTIKHRLKRLSPDAARLIQRVSVAGKRIELSLLKELSAEDEGLFELLEELVERQFLLREPEAFYFPHDRVRETLYASLDPELRKDIHQQVALWLEAQGEPASVLAWHFKHGRDRVKAMQYLLQAGDESSVRMEATLLMHEGLLLLENLVNLPGQAEQLETQRRKLAWVSYMIHPFICAETNEKLIQSLKQRNLPLSEQIEFESILISSYTMIGRNGEAMQRARDLLRQLKPETISYALILFSRLNALLTRGEFRQLITEMETAATILKDHLDSLPRQLVWAYAFCCFIREDAIAWLGEPVGRDGFAEVPRQIGEQYDFLDLSFWSYYPEVVRNSLIGRYYEIKEVSDEIFTLIKKMGRPIQHENRFQICLAYAAIEHGELEEGGHYATKVVELGQRMKNKHQQASGKILQGMISEQRNHLDDAIQAFGEAIQLSRESETDQLLPAMYRLAGVYLRQKRHDLADALLSEAIELATGLRLENPYHQIQIYRLQAKLEIAREGEPARIEELLQRSINLAIETQNPLQLGFSHLAMAKWRAEKTRTDDALAELEHAKSAFAQIRYRKADRALQELRTWIRQQQSTRSQQAVHVTLPLMQEEVKRLIKPDLALELGYRMVEMMQQLNLGMTQSVQAHTGELRQLSERLEKVERVNQFSQLIMKSLDLQLVLNNIMDYVIDISKADRGLLMLRDEQGELSVQVMRTRDETLPQSQLLKFSNSFTQKALASGQSIWIADAQADQELSQQASIMALDLRTIICVPLKREQEVIGLIYLDRQAISESFSQQDLELVESMGTFATISLVNARLHAQIQERNEHLQMLNDISRAISTTLVFEELLNKVLEFCLKLTQAEIGYIFISKDINAEPANFEALECQASQDQQGRPLEELQVSRSIIAKVLASKQPVCLVDMNEDAQLAAQKSIMALELRALMCVPIYGRREQILGLVYVSSQAVSYTFTERDLALMESIIRQVGLDIENRHLMELRKKQELMDQELALARNIQSSMLPDYSPDIPSLDIVGFSQQAAAVGGDYYDYFKISDFEFGLAIGDVNGHGVSAGLLMSMAKSCLFVQGKIDPSVLAVMSALNSMIFGGTKERLFMTFVYSIFDLVNQTVTLSSAGHHLPYHYSARQKALKPVQVKPTYPLGVREKVRFNEVTLELNPDDILVYYTDGINEAHSPEGEEFGFERIEQLILKHHARGAAE